MFFDQVVSIDCLAENCEPFNLRVPAFLRLTMTQSKFTQSMKDYADFEYSISAVSLSLFTTVQELVCRRALYDEADIFNCIA